MQRRVFKVQALRIIQAIRIKTIAIVQTNDLRQLCRIQFRICVQTQKPVARRFIRATAQALLGQTLFDLIELGISAYS